MDYEAEVNALKKQVRCQRICLFALGFGLVSLIGLGMAGPQNKEMVLENLIITSKDGTPRIMMGTNEEDGGIGLAMLDTKGVARVALGTDVKGDGGMVIMDKDETPKIMMGSGPEGAGIMLIGAGITELPAMPEAPKK